MIFVGALLCMSLAWSGSATAAVNIHNLNFTILDESRLNVSWKATGLGNTETVEVELQAQAVRVCENKPSKKPPGLKRTFVSVKEQFSVDNGKVDFDLTTDPVKACPGKMKQTVTFENVIVVVLVDGEQVAATDPVDIS
jgi:hypothetical protein